MEAVCPAGTSQVPLVTVAVEGRPRLEYAGVVSAPLLSPSKLALTAVLVATAFGLLNATIVLTADWATGETPSVAFALLMELTGAYTFLIVLPVMIYLARRFPVSRENWWHRVPLHLACSIGVGVSHTLLMWGTRTAAYAILDWGTYDYGLMRFRFVMEYAKQLIAYMLTYGVTRFFMFAREARDRDVRTARLAEQLTEARLGTLKMQLNPHFVFNALNMISASVHEEPRQADTMIGHLGQFLRDTLRHSNVQEIPLDQELRALDSYLAITKARFAERLTVTLAIDDETRLALVPHLLLQPLLENAVTHGTGQSQAPGRIRIAAARAGDQLQLTIEDNGPGLDGMPADEAVTKGVGLANTVERLRALYGEGPRLTLTERDGGGLRVAIRLPWRTPGAAS